MPRLTQITSDAANRDQSELFAAVQAKLGRVPNLMRAMANAPAALRGYLELNGALGSGTGLTAKQRELIALTVAESNGCEYCLAAHSTLGKMAGLSPEAIAAARRGDGVEREHQALARFVQAILHRRGRIDDQQLASFRAAGFSDEAITEVVGHVALNIFTNYFNNLAETEVDFPAAAPLGHVQGGREQVGYEQCSTTACQA